MRVLIEDTIYEVIAQEGKEVCILQTYDYFDGLKRQLKIWTKDYIEYKGEVTMPSLAGSQSMFIRNKISEYPETTKKILNKLYDLQENYKFASLFSDITFGLYKKPLKKIKSLIHIEYKKYPEEVKILKEVCGVK